MFFIIDNTTVETIKYMLLDSSSKDFSTRQILEQVTKLGTLASMQPSPTPPKAVPAAKEAAEAKPKN